MTPTACLGNTCGTRVSAPPSAPLTQIRKNYVTNWQGLALTVENGIDCWTVRVQAPGDAKARYEAHRGTLAAAKAAGLEFAMFHAGGSALDSPERLAGALTWRERWL